MGPPSWLYYLFAVAMLVVAAYGVALFALSLNPPDPSGRDVDVAHLAMGVSMAGMFVPAWAFWPSGFWQLVFGGLLVWFGVRSIQSVRRYGLHLPHEAVHTAMSLAMLLMYWYPASADRGSTAMAMSMSSGAPHGALDPGVGLVLVVCLCWSAVFTLASPEKGVSHHGRHRRAVRPAAAVLTGTPSFGTDGTVGPADTVDPAGGAAGGPLASPVLEDLSHVVMCVAMAFMLVLMM